MNTCGCAVDTGNNLERDTDRGNVRVLNHGHSISVKNFYLPRATRKVDKT